MHGRMPLASLEELQIEFTTQSKVLLGLRHLILEVKVDRKLAIARAPIKKKMAVAHNI